MNEDKLKLANELKKQIEEVKDFIGLLETGGELSKEFKKPNQFTQLYISANIWTGSDNPPYNERIHNPEIIKKCADSMIIVLREILSQKEIEFENIFK